MKAHNRLTKKAVYKLIAIPETGQLRIYVYAKGERDIWVNSELDLISSAIIYIGDN